MTELIEVGAGVTMLLAAILSAIVDLRRGNRIDIMTVVFLFLAMIWLL